MLADLASPLMIACWGMAISFNRFASISKCCGVEPSPWTARCIACNCPIDVDRINLLDFDECHIPTCSLLFDLLRKFLTGRSVELFRIVDTDYPRAGLQDHGGSRDRPGERAHSGLVHARNGMVTALPERRLEAKHFAEALSLRPVFEAPLVDQGHNSTRSSPAVGA